MADGSNSAPATPIDNCLRQRRRALGLSQKQLGEMAGITRQAVAAVETGQYSPATSVALQLARALACRVEDLFSLRTQGEIVEAELVGAFSFTAGPVRAQVTRVGDRLIAQSLEGVGELASLSTTADGLMLGPAKSGKRVKVHLCTERVRLREKLVIAGCDPAMFLAAEHVRRRAGQEIAPRLMGSSMALSALKRGDAHAAGVHFTDGDASGMGAALKRQLAGMDCVVVTFAHWEEGFLVAPGNPKRIRSVNDLVRRNVKIVNRERGSGARRLLDRQMADAGISGTQVKGYRNEALSHLDVAWRVESGLADVGVGVRAAAKIRGLDFLPLQRERYDLIIAKTYFETLPGCAALFDTIVGAPFRSELEALGGYDTRDIGRIVAPA